MYRQFYVQKLPNVAETRGDKPTGDISGGSLGSPSWTQFTYFAVYTRACSREGSGKGVRVTEGKLWHRVL